MNLKIEIIPTGYLEVNCTIVKNLENKKGFVVDPGGDADKIDQILEKDNITLDAILFTHGHFDHIMGCDPLVQATRAKGIIPVIWFPEKDLYLWEHLTEQAGRFGISAPAITSVIDKPYTGKIEITAAEIAIDVIPTPGHSPGSSCFYLKDQQGVLISGDTIFRGSIGRSDLWMGSYEELLESIKTEIFTLPEETTIIPGHGPNTTVDFEKSNNPFFQ